MLDEHAPVALQQQIVRLRRSHGELRVQQLLEDLDRHGDVIDDPVLWLDTAAKRRFRYTPIEAVQRCTCGADTIVPVGRFVYWNLLGICRCATCGVLLASPRLTDAAMRGIFGSSYFKSQPPAFWGERREPIFAEILALLHRYECRTVFDVGAAYGHLLAYLCTSAISGAGCDVSGPTVAWGRANLGVDLHLGSVQEVVATGIGSTFAAVVSLDTLYYTASPVDELRAMRRLLRPGGVLVLRLRNGLRSLARALMHRPGRIGAPVMPAGHLWAFTPTAMRRLLAFAGFEVLETGPAAYSRTSLLPLHGAACATSRAAARVGIPLFTRSFNIVARASDGG